jgi:hypothetical protein
VSSSNESKNERQIRTALLDGLADGLRQHLPDGVRIVVCGGPLLVVAAVAHALLGTIPLMLMSGATGVGAGAAAVARKRRQPPKANS